MSPPLDSLTDRQVAKALIERNVMEPSTGPTFTSQANKRTILSLVILKVGSQLAYLKISSG